MDFSLSLLVESTEEVWFACSQDNLITITWAIWGARHLFFLSNQTVENTEIMTEDGIIWVKLETVKSCETLVSNHITTWHHNPEDRDLKGVIIFLLLIYISFNEYLCLLFVS
jgi:hypothetical protein